MARVGDVMDRETPCVPANMKLAELSDLVGDEDSPVSQRQGTLIVNEQQQLIGIITRGDMVRALRRDPSGATTVSEAGSTNLVTTHSEEPLRVALAKMLGQNIGRLPVVDRNDPTRVVGYLGRAAVLSARMRLLHEEHHRERG